MSRKNGSENSPANGVVLPSRVCAPPIVTTERTTRSAASTRAVPREDPGYPRPPPPLGRAKTSQHDAAHHSVQEATRHDVESGHEPAPRPSRVRHIAGGFRFVPPLLRKRGEIVRADKRPRRAAERV